VQYVLINSPDKKEEKPSEGEATPAKENAAAHEVPSKKE